MAKYQIIVVSLVLVLMVPGVSAWLLFDDFESGFNWTTSGTDTWVRVTTNPYSPIYHAEVSSTGGDAYITKNVSTVGYSNVGFSYVRKLVGVDTADEFAAQWWDGGAWNTVEATGTASEDGGYVVRSFALNGYADNNAALRLRFLCNVGAVSEYCRVDNVLLNAIETQAADFSIVAQGVTETDIGERVENTWSVVSRIPVSILDVQCDFFQMMGINDTENEELINSSLLDVEYVIENYTFRVYWDANGSLVDEGKNVEVECNATVNGIEFSGISQFVYVNRERTLWQMIGMFYSYVLQMLGIAEDTQQLVSAQAEMVDAKVEVGGTGYATTFLTYADGTVDENASCYLDVWYPDSVQWIDGQQMNASGSDGRYTYGLEGPAVTGVYQMRSYCNGSALMNRTRYAYANLEVFDGIVMEMIS